MNTPRRHLANQRRVLTVAMVATMAAAGTAPTSAQINQSEIPVLSKPARTTDSGAVSGQQLGGNGGAGKLPTSGQNATYWYDGTRKRMLTIDHSSIADFGSVMNPKSAPEITRADLLSSKISSDHQTSPMLRSAESGQLTGALAGGVLVRLTRPMAMEDAEAVANAFGAQVRRPLGSPVAAGHDLWLFDSPAGLESLELANRIHESGQVKSAAPNWWKPRTLK
ncbi:MAG: hypothetical protein ACRBC3_00970 [Burkholderiaceae bacterium]